MVEAEGSLEKLEVRDANFQLDIQEDDKNPMPDNIPHMGMVITQMTTALSMSDKASVSSPPSTLLFNYLIVFTFELKIQFSYIYYSPNFYSTIY